MYKSECFYNISIHALREEGDLRKRKDWSTRMELISIHALREEGDLLLLRAEPYLMEISIHALREEGDRQAFQVQKYYEISIHALREEGDKADRERLQLHQHFYPRPPRGGRLRRVTYGSRKKEISIHALREEGDTAKRTKNINVRPFLSTPSARRATSKRGGHSSNKRFLSTPSARRATCQFSSQLQG